MVKNFYTFISENEKTTEHHASVIPLTGFSPISHMGHAKDLGSAMKKLPGKKHIGISSKADLYSDKERADVLRKQWDQHDLKTHVVKSAGETIARAHKDLPKHGKKVLHLLVGHDRKSFAHGLKKSLEDGKIKEMGHNKWDEIQIHHPEDSDRSHGMSGTNMRKAAESGNVKEFHRHLGPSFNKDEAKEHMKKFQSGISSGKIKVNRPGNKPNVNEDLGMFKAVFITGGPGSGKDIIIREVFNELPSVELNTVQVFDYLTDKVRLSEHSSDYRREAIRSRAPLIINGPADDFEKIIYIKEELEELGYETMMLFVNTTNEISEQRNRKLNRMISESLRFNKWQESQKFHNNFAQQFKNMLSFDNSYTYNEIKDQIHETFRYINDFVTDKDYNDIAYDWLKNHNKLNINESFKYLFKENTHVGKDSKSIQIKTVGKYNPNFRAASPADIPADNRQGGNRFGQTDSIKGDTFPRKNPNGYSIAGGAGAGAYAATEETKPTLKIGAKEKVPNFEKDNNIIKTGKSKTSGNPVTGGRNTAGSGPGQTFSDRSGLQMGLGETKRFSAFRKQVTKEAIDDPGLGDPGLGGVAGGTSNKEGMQMYADRDQKMKMAGIQINKKKKGAK